LILLGNISSQPRKAYLNTSIITDFDVLDERSTSYNNTSTFMSTDKWKLGWQWPVTVHSVQVCVANAGVFDVDENFVRAWLLNGDPLVDNS
jgi:hypothetical protein